MLLLLAFPMLKAGMTAEQRVHDFNQLAAVFAKRYAPYEWKKQVAGFDLLDTAPWLDRVRRAKDDLEFMEICSEYVARLDDTHTQYTSPGRMIADLGFYVDIYDGKVLVEQINRARLPAARFPFQVGDELVSLDGKTAEEWIAAFAKVRRRGSATATRRTVADLITYRPQTVVPRVVELGDTAQVVIRRDGGELETYTVPWTKTGVPMTEIGPVPSPKAQLKAASTEAPEYLRLLSEMRNWSAPAGDHLLQGEVWSEEAGEMVPRRYVLGIGSRAPAYGMPAGFIQRLGRISSHFHFSGTYESGGYKIGLLRVRSFSPSNQAAAIAELDDEIPYMQQNTDGLVVDVMRNPGGGCYMLDVAARLIPQPFWFFGEEHRVTLDRVNTLQAALDSAIRLRAEQWIIDTYAAILDQMKQAYQENRGRTGPIPACTQWGSADAPSFLNLPAKVVYTKPVIFLIDDFSISAADIFPSMMQDNARGPLVGTRTNGAGGQNSGPWHLMYSEAYTTCTATLVTRKAPVVTPEYPTAHYIENVGARADIPLDYMTRENLMTGGRPFVDGFTRIIVDEIRKSRGQ
ncbi:MAG: S41 family peptidase [Bryobacteraceae bacterium]